MKKIIINHNLDDDIKAIEYLEMCIKSDISINYAKKWNIKKSNNIKNEILYEFNSGILINKRQLKDSKGNHYDNFTIINNKSKAR